MDIVIPYRKDVLNGLELKYALRSIEKNLSGWNNIVIIGIPPAWLLLFSPAFVYTIMMDDVDGRKEYSCYRKLLAACNDENISENFVYWNDDHWLLQPLHVSEIKNWYNGSLEKELNGNHSGRWRAAAMNTLQYWPSIKNYDIHRPIVFHKMLFKSIFSEHGQQLKLNGKELCIKSMYCAYLSENRSEYAEDCNIGNQLTAPEIEKQIEGRLFCSSKGGITKEYFKVLEKLFPEKSKFEL